MLKKIESYFLSSYELVDSRTYYLNLSIVMGLALTVFVFLFDPYDNYSHPLKHAVPMSLVQIGYGLNLTFVIYVLYRFIFLKIGKSIWKTYHHWLSLVIIHIVAGFSGTIYHRLFIDVGVVDFNYYLFVTIPRSILIGGVLFAILVLHEKLQEKNKHIKSLQNSKSKNNWLETIAKSPKNGPILLKSPTVNQSIEIKPLDIIFLKAFGNYVEIHLKDKERSLLLRSPLHFVAEQLTSFSYIRKCHRQYYININEIEFYSKNSERLFLNIKNSSSNIPVSKKFTKEITSLVDSLQ